MPDANSILFSSYNGAIAALILAVIITLVQGFLGAVFGFVKGGKTPGAALDGDHANIGFRALRTYQNSTENLPAFAVAVIAAIVVGASASLINMLAWLYVGSRLLFWGVYYAGVGKPAGGPRSMIYVLGWAINLIIAGVALFAVI